MTAQVPAVSDEDAAAFQVVRPRLLAVARRVLRNGADAEDVVQETWLRWQRTDRSAVEDVPTFLATTTLRLAINVTRSARVRREALAGPWLAEPVDVGADPAAGVDTRGALSFALRVLLTRLSAPERAAYILREAFDYPYRRIGDALAMSEANARQLVSRARGRLRRGHGGLADAAEHRRLLAAFVAADDLGDLPALERLLASDVRSRRRARPVVGSAA
jgi:RNA polymerase sigma-70 factor (ECF subfamily)